MSTEYKSLKVPTWVYDNLVAARGEMVRNGLDSIPSALREPPVCPHCGGPVDYLRVEYEQIACRAATCGYKQQAITTEGNTLAAIGLGVVLGIGATALFVAMAESKKRPTRKALRAKPKRRRA